MQSTFTNLLILFISKMDTESDLTFQKYFSSRYSAHYFLPIFVLFSVAHSLRSQNLSQAPTLPTGKLFPLGSSLGLPTRRFIPTGNFSSHRKALFPPGGSLLTGNLSSHLEALFPLGSSHPLGSSLITKKPPSH